VTTDPPDKRRNPYRDDLAAEFLKGRVAAKRYVAGERRQVVHSAAQLRERPDAQAAWTTEALFGETVTVFDQKDGWAWVQLEGDDYVGYMREIALSDQVQPPTHMVRALAAFLYPEPDIKTPPWMHISMTATLCVTDEGPVFSKLADGRHVPSRHIVERTRFAADFVGVAERFVGVPYVWGGKTRLGVDCSGLVQVAMQAAGRVCPRDSDMQQAELGSEIAVTDALDTLQRGDLVFWKGHVGIMTDGFMLLHANAHHMAVVIEPLKGATDRIARTTASRIVAIKRPAGKTA
jgi:cell wall-associated NlpC family hydrolase